MANMQEPQQQCKKVRRSARNFNRDRKISLRQNPPDLCLDAIYRHIPLERLLLGSTQLISKSWHLARTRALAKRETLYLICDKKEDSVAFIRDKVPYIDKVCKYIKRKDDLPLISQVPWEQLEFDAVNLPTERLTVKFTSFLLNKLPKITHLAVLASGSIETLELEQVIRLLEHHSAHLVKLHLSLDQQIVTQHFVPQTITRLFETINRLAVLEHLKLNLYFTEDHERPPLSILSRLTSFSLDSNQTLPYITNQDWLYSSVRQYATNSATLRSIGCEDMPFRHLVRLDPQIVGKINWLKVYEDYVENVKFSKILQLFPRFKSLTCLVIELTLPLNMLARCLALVPSLIYLELEITTLLKERATNEPNIRYQLPSVLELSLSIRVKSHEELDELNIAFIFPNIQVIKIQHEVERCSGCGFKSRMATNERVVQCRRVVREMLLAGCQNLHRITYYSEDPQREGLFDHEII